MSTKLKKLLLPIIILVSTCTIAEPNIQATQNQSELEYSVTRLRGGCGYPEYPPTAVQKNESGEVIVGLLLNKDGRVKSYKILKSSGYSDLDETSIDAFKTCVFEPLLKEHAPIEGWTKMQWVWRMDGK